MPNSKKSTTVEILYQFETDEYYSQGAESTTVEILYQFETSFLRDLQYDLQQQKFYISLKQRCIQFES